MSDLYVSEIFTSIQGEGAHAGKPAVFVRLQGCNLRCPWCDEPKALEFNRGAPMLLDDIVAKILPDLRSVRYLVLTGGEPTAQDCGPLIERLATELDGPQTPASRVPFLVSIETNGTLRPRLWVSRTHVTLSPKTAAGGKAPHPEMVGLADEIKYVVEEGTDLEAVYQEYKKVPYTKPWLFLMPEDSQQEKVLGKIIKFVMEHPLEARVSLRLHKLLKVK